jgi:outer membrane protein insertion porin family
MSERLAGAGFPFAEVTPVGNRNFETRTIDVSYVVDQGQRAFIERIEIIGNARTRDYVIRREFDLAEGDAFNQILLRRAQKRLEALDFFERVDISTRPGSAPDRVIIVVNAVDKSTGEFGIGAGYTTGSGDEGGVSVEGNITERNFLGRGQTLRISAGGGIDSRSYNLSFTEPYFLGYRLAATFGAFRRTKDYDTYDVASTGGSISFGLPITEELNADVGYLFQQDEYSNVAATAPTSIVADIGANGTSWTKSAATYGLTYNTIDDTQDPRDGLFLRLRQEAAGLGGDAKHISTTFNGSVFKTISEEAELVGALKFGAGHITGIGQDLRTVDHFRLGPQQIRGFAYNGIGPTENGGSGAGSHIGGKSYLHATAEAQFPLPALSRDLGFKGAVFADAATLFGHDSATAANTSMEWRASAGFGLIWHSPFAPLRVDYAIPLVKETGDEEQRFNFSVSTAF